MKRLDFFKFNAFDWLAGSIQLLSPEEKGTFIDLCAMAWKESGSVVADNVAARKLRIDYATLCDRIKSYTELGIVVCDGNVLSVNFLDKQLGEYDETCKRNSENAKKRWDSMRPHANKNRIEENRRDKEEKIEPPIVPQGDDVKTFKQWTSSDFIEEIKSKKKEYTNCMLNEFYKYWTEPSANGVMRFQLQKTWETSRRLSRWHSNNPDDDKHTDTIKNRALQPPPFAKGDAK